MVATDKPKIPRTEALKVANEIYKLLEPWCEKCKVVGSLRRRRPFVKDVEFLFIGKTMTRKKDLLENEEYNGGLAEIDFLVKTEVIRPRENIIGNTAWGDKNRLAVHVATGISIDFFTATPENWWNLLVCRTGGLINNTRLAQAYLKRGLHWHPYDEGYTDLKGKSFHQLSEQSVFINAGLQYIPPERRL